MFLTKVFDKSEKGGPFILGKHRRTLMGYHLFTRVENKIGADAEIVNGGFALGPSI